MLRIKMQLPIELTKTHVKKKKKKLFTFKMLHEQSVSHDNLIM